MTTATGPADRLLDAREELTPMLRQYLDLTETYPDSLVLFRVGDFYKTFCAAAEETARVCELTLVQREDSTGTYPMAGIPVDNAATYIERLLDAGYRVAVADQVEDPEEATGLVDRAVTRIVTPGTVVDDELLTAGTANYVACVTAGEQVAGDASAPGDGTATDGGAAATQTTLPSGAGDVPYAVAAVDVSTGECLVTSATDRSRLLEELERVGPAEVLAGPNISLDLADLDHDATPTEHDTAIFERDAAETRLSAYAPRPSAVVANDAELRACGAVLAYAEYTQGGDRLEYVSRITRYDPRDYLRLDATALRSLELFESRSPNDGATLQSVLDDTSCALGRRKLAAWLRRPLVDEHAIDARLDAVEELTDDALARDALRDRLRDVYDLERLIGRVARGRANARDLRSLGTTLSTVPDLRAELDEASSERLRELRAELDPLADVRDLIDRAIQPDPPVEVTEGDVIREGYDDDLDDLRRTEREGREWVADLEASERERTGIDNLDVGYNQVHGYYIEVTNANLDRVPDDYTRRQTLKNAERFYTPELKRREDEILGAAERADSLEYELFTEVRDAVAAEADRVQSLAEAVAELDVLATLAAVAVEHDYVRPEVGTDGVEIRGGRHPVVEQTQDFFVPNDATLDEARIAVITGPNMSGKSTYMRQVALVAVLAQMGAFVPADSAHLPVFDRVFTRVGASDDIAGGQSTFMREMRELTDILHHATEDSLVLLDEVGRGTSTTDGLAIARATTEFVDDEVGAYTLFATHYHELTRIADERENVFNLHFTATRDGDDVTFLHTVEHGASSSSYGVEVARMAGVPDRVVDRARDLVDDSPDESPATPDDRDRADDGAADADRTDDGAAGDADRPDDNDDRAESVAERLRAIDLARTTPLEALNTLYELQTELESGGDSTER